uniref:Uncharacterized protein n=1 Tax=Schistocephalus solidus TaxID=70667 RepID=A0A0X3PZL9_SCHSO
MGYMSIQTQLPINLGTSAIHTIINPNSSANKPRNLHETPFQQSRIRIHNSRPVLTSRSGLLIYLTGYIAGRHSFLVKRFDMHNQLRFQVLDCRRGRDDHGRLLQSFGTFERRSVGRLFEKA